MTETGDKSRTKQWQRFVLAVLRFFAARLQKMPRAQAMRFGERFGKFAFFACRHIVKRPYRTALGNLSLTSFPSPEATPKQRDALVQGVFIHFGKSMVDFLRGPLLTPDELAKLVSVEGLEHLQQAQAAGKGTLIITAHFGNWEMLGRCVVAHGMPMTVVAREPEDEAFGAYVKSLRENAGFEVAYKGGSVRELLSLLKKNHAVGLLPDQNSGDLFVPFFGVPAGTVAGPATLALHTGAALLRCFCVRLPDDRYRLILLPPLDTRSTGDKEADIRRIMCEVNTTLESMVRQYPEQWLWLHHRWKSALEEPNRERAWGSDSPAQETARMRWQKGRNNGQFPMQSSDTGGRSADRY